MSTCEVSAALSDEGNSTGPTFEAIPGPGVFGKPGALRFRVLFQLRKSASRIRRSFPRSRSRPTSRTVRRSGVIPVAMSSRAPGRAVELRVRLKAYEGAERCNKFTLRASLRISQLRILRILLTLAISLRPASRGSLRAISKQPAEVSRVVPCSHPGAPLSGTPANEVLGGLHNVARYAALALLLRTTPPCRVCRL